MALTGFGNHLESEAVAGVLPVGQNSPQHVAHGLYAEQLSGTAFTAPRCANQRSWLYRTHPSVCHGPFVRYTGNAFAANGSLFDGAAATPAQLRWGAPPVRSDADFVDGLVPYACAGDPCAHSGLAVYMYAAGRDMAATRAFCSADGTMLLVPQSAGLRVTTEFGVLEVPVGSVCVVQRGIRFRVGALGAQGGMRGYVLEVYSGHFELPDLGPLGANGLANPQDFVHPAAAFERPATGASYEVVTKTDNALFVAAQAAPPMNVVAWRGNYVPYAYDLARFVAFGSVSVDHPDPSIFTVLTAKSAVPGTAVADFVVFPPRWQAAERTFRPPYFHRNVMAEFMGVVRGVYEAKPAAGDGEGFVPGGASLHPACTAHGPDAECLEKALKEDTTRPVRVADGSLAFMFETSLQLRVTPHALASSQPSYNDAWAGIPVIDI